MQVIGEAQQGEEIKQYVAGMMNASAAGYLDKNLKLIIRMPLETATQSMKSTSLKTHPTAITA